MNVRYRHGSFVFHKLSFAVHSLGGTVSHDLIVIIKDWVDRKWPRIISCNPKDILEGNGFFVRLIHGVGGLLFETINRPNASHETVTYVHEHTGGKEKGADTEEGHDADQMYHDGVERALIVRTEKVVPSKHGQGVCRTGPSVQQKQQKVFCCRFSLDGF